MVNKKIYDGFLFFNELDLLEIRLNILNDVVDKFILVESSVTHSGLPKPFYFEENKERFSNFLDKIIHIKITNTPDDFINIPTEFTDDHEGYVFKSIYGYINKSTDFNKETEKHFGRDLFQKECIKLGMKNCHDNDIIICSDLDEIPNPEILERLNEFYEDNSFYTFSQTNHCYYFNIILESQSNNSPYNTEITTKWNGSRMGSFKLIKDYSLSTLRTQENNIIMDGGWHFSFMGGIDRVKTKLKSYSHQECNNDTIMNGLEDNFAQNKDVINRPGKLIQVEFDDTYPKYFLNNLEKYPQLIKL